MDERGGNKIIRGFVPLSEMFGYSNTLRSLTQGRASFSMEFEHYEAVPSNIATEVVTKRKEEGKIR
mgnify:FL=1|jgi:elongation factor G